MKYLPDSAPQSYRAKHTQIELLKTALQEFITTTQTPERHIARAFLKSLPTHMPYTIVCYPHEWAVITRALRPSGSNPVTGSPHARYYALYQTLRRHMVFLTAGDIRRTSRRKVRP